MNNRKINEGLNRAFHNLTPEFSEKLFSEGDRKDGKVVVMVEKKNKVSAAFKSLAAVAAMFILLIGGAGIYGFQTGRAVDSIIALEVNPSVEIQVNKKNTVLKVNPLNEDGRIIIGDMNFKGSDLDLTVNALVGSMLREGYLSDLANSILITVDNADAAKGQALQEKLTADINKMFSTGSNGCDFALLSQTVTGDEELKKRAEAYGVSIGKAQLIQEVMKKNATYKFEDLTGRSINDLNLLLSGQGAVQNTASAQKIETVGKASDKKYIGEDAAKEKALVHAGVKNEDAVFTECGMDWEKGVMVYEMEFMALGCEYEYDVNAATGEIVKADKEIEKHVADTAPSESGQKPQQPIQKVQEADAAKNAALAHAGVSAADIWDYSIESDVEHGISVYEIEFKAGGYEYDYEIDASTLAILKSDKERDD